MDDQVFEFIEDRAARSLVKQMLAAVVDRPDLHLNRFQYHLAGGGRYEYFLAETGAGSAFPQPARLDINVVPLLIGRGWVGPDTSGMSGPGWNSFTEEAIAAYRASKVPNNAGIRRAIGQYLVRQQEQFGGDVQIFRPEAIA